MTKKYYFMSGLPRSGSTLLSTLLNQNPEIYSGPSSPVLGIMVGVHENFLSNELYLNERNLIIHIIELNIINQYA